MSRVFILAASSLLLVTGFAAAVPAPSNPLTGTVYAKDGKPAAGAVVWAAKLTHGPLERRETVADANGRYELQLDPGRWFVWARLGTQGGVGLSAEPVQMVAERAAGPINIRLEERGTFRGRLFEAESNKPIPGARLFLDAGVALATDAQGRFEIGGLARERHEAFVVAPGRMRMRVLFDTTARADTELEVPVPRGGKIVGRVTNLDDKPIAGAYVGRFTSGSFFSINGLFGACDGDGRFNYDDAAPTGQPTRLTGLAPGYVEEERDGLEIPADGRPLEVNFRLRPTPSEKPNAKAVSEDKRRVVSGVIHNPDGKPAADVLVRWGYQPYVGAIEARTGADGRFRITVPDKADMLAVLPRDCTPEFPKVEAGGDQLVEVTLRTGHTASGKVQDDMGLPIAGVRVLAMTGSPDPRLGNPFWLSEAAVQTDAAGRFLLKGVPAHARFDFLKHGLSDERNRELKLDGTDNLIILRYGGAIKGQILDRDGKPIRNFRVLVNIPRNRRPDDKSGGYFAGFAGIGVRFTSPDGTFVLTDLVAGNVHRIRVLADGHGDAVADRVTAAPMNHLEVAKPEILRAAAPATLRVSAVTTSGQPIAGALVTLVNGDPQLDRSFSWGYHNASWEDMVRGRTNADGWAVFPSLGFSDATVLAQAAGYGRRHIPWRDGGKELTVKLAKEAVVAGEVFDADGRPEKKFYVNLRSDGDQVLPTDGPDENGRFRFTEIPAGTWTLTVRGADGLTTLYTERVTLNAGEKKEVSFGTKKE